MSTNFVTSTGFNKKTLQEIKSEIEADFQDIFGEDIDLDPSGVIGQFIALLAKRESDLWDGAEEIFSSRDPNSATGLSLDNIVAENGIQRISATETVIQDALLNGADATLVVAGKRAKNINQTVEYILDADVTIEKENAREGYISVDTATVGLIYRVTINSVNYDYTALMGTSKTIILTGLKNLIDAGSWTGTTSVTDEVLKIEDTTDFDFNVNGTTGTLVIDSISSAGNFTADTTGAYTIAANTLTEIVTPVTGWDGINNPDPGITGSDTETDDELRIRREQSIQNGKGTDDAILEAILNNVSGVTAVIVTSNRSDITDGEGRPPHSFEAVVSGGADADIAQEIFDSQPAGITSFGTETETVTDTQGYSHVIQFSRSESKYIWVRVSRDLYSEEDYPDDGDDLIKQAIVDWSLETDNIDVGKDVIRQRISIPVYTIPGIEDIKIELYGSTNPAATPSYAESNITISARQLAVFAVSRMVVQDLTP